MNIPEGLVLGETVKDVSDGYHTFRELYAFRMAYNVLLFNEWALQGKHCVHKSKRHSDGELCFDGEHFVVVALLPSGQVTNHYKLEHWDKFKVDEFHMPLVEFDGHSSADVLDRLNSLL